MILSKSITSNQHVSFLAAKDTYLTFGITAQMLLKTTVLWQIYSGLDPAICQWKMRKTADISHIPLPVSIHFPLVWNLQWERQQLETSVRGFVSFLLLTI